MATTPAASGRGRHPYAIAYTRKGGEIGGEIGGRSAGDRREVGGRSAGGQREIGGYVMEHTQGGGL